MRPLDHEVMAAGHRAMASAHRQLAETLERWPGLANDVLESTVRARGLGTTSILRAELRLRAAPDVELLDEPQRCPWVPELMEATLATGVIALWPGGPMDLAKALVAESSARQALARADQDWRQEGEVSDESLDRLTDAARLLPPGPLLELVACAALEGNAPHGWSPRTCHQVAMELGRRSAA